MSEPIHDPTVTLRLELGRVTDQRDAYQKAFSTEVLKVVRVAIIQATIDADEEIALLRERVDNLVIKNNERHAELHLLDAKNRDLQSEVERLRASSFVTAVPVEEYEKLKSEVERLKNNLAYLDNKLDEELDK